MMNYSDYDSDGYSSNEDADYVPSGEDNVHLQRCPGEMFTVDGVVNATFFF